eukprot:TRINITY_DN25633_c0_g1_i1.p2 TRINITY_DN25633_c0_g1~~TRINITY_DN25633_c0_g1_i1.p2  ORF type:complete len:112 (+),score=13.43 TRINITY_DN25633_c0_g1_i1:44-379(+)
MSPCCRSATPGSRLLGSAVAGRVARISGGRVQAARVSGGWVQAARISDGWSRLLGLAAAGSRLFGSVVTGSRLLDRGYHPRNLEQVRPIRQRRRTTQSTSQHRLQRTRDRG